jgi:hypothetical protein
MVWIREQHAGEKLPCTAQHLTESFGCPFFILEGHPQFAGIETQSSDLFLAGQGAIVVLEVVVFGVFALSLRHGVDCRCISIGFPSNSFRFCGGEIFPDPVIDHRVILFQVKWWHRRDITEDDRPPFPCLTCVIMMLLGKAINNITGLTKLLEC